MFRSFRFKITVVIFLLIAVSTAVYSVFVLESMDRTNLEALIRKGFSVGGAIAAVAGDATPTPEGQHRLESKLAEYHEETLFLAVVDGEGRIVAHSNPSMRGMPFSMVEGEVLETREDGSTVRKVLRASVLNYEFMVPVVSSGSPVGRLYLALDAHTLAAQRQEALRRILLLSLVVLVLGAAGVYAVSSRFTAPIERLSEGITRLPGARQAEEIYISSRDELGDLTLKFNTMARTITEQKRELRENADELERAYVSTLRLLATVIDARDPYTRGHSARVARLSVLLGRKMGLVEEELRDLEVASMFHDVGKIKTPDSILNKKEPLNGEEYEEMMRHTRHGADILDVVDSLKKYVPAVLFHHERFDGSGYPEGLRQAEIPLIASLISIPDAFDAMTSARPYRPAMSREEAVREMLRFKGVQFDPRMLEHFIKALEGYEPDRPGFTFLVDRELT
jgi:HD-GYP domain-containing protein (c-di-GMP phosphodiesterase class II)/uncharacterized membrane protein affecting hemolysin expression